jgi:hypothetical protein
MPEILLLASLVPHTRRLWPHIGETRLENSAHDMVSGWSSHSKRGILWGVSRRTNEEHPFAWHCANL